MNRAISVARANPLIWVISVVTALLTGCVSSDPVTAETIVLARLNNQPVTLADAMNTYSNQHRGHNVLVQGDAALRDLTGRILERRVLLEEARALEIPESLEVEQAVEEYRYRSAEGLFWKREVDDKVHVSEEEVDSFYDKTDVGMSLSLIAATDLETASRLRERVESGEDFADLAHAESTHPSASFGGSLGFMRRGELDPALELAAFALVEQGSITEIVQTSDGFVFARLDERVVNTNRPDRDEAMPQIRSILEERATDVRREELEQTLLEAAAAEVDETLLHKSTLLAEESQEAVVARSAGEELTLMQFREALNLEAIQATPEQEVAEAAQGIAWDWAKKKAVRKRIVAIGLLDDPDVGRHINSYREETILSILYRDYVYADLDTTDEEMRAYYEENPQQFTRPGEVRLAHILSATEEESQGILQRLNQGENFADLVQELSTDRASAVHGGRVGWFAQGNMHPNLSERAFALEPGAIDGPIETDLGFHVIQVLDRKESYLLPYEQARIAAKKIILKKASQQAYQGWVTRLRDRAQVEISDDGIQQAVRWLEQQRSAEEEQPVLSATSAEPPQAHP